ncbi:acyltransferase family protein [Gordonia sp. HNM0687]|uniref:Acyltransferase family protein n=1 Tax=Gordonia mangrovi TaxID=2665643 RepID=A0A6L7GQZ1_9ACTN|nr:acyltransferase [Gordonia mangrovi]MXP21611.1 acyltransferase family protein [Gordonia mangrovi]UVF80353.1 acyltransferase [Gordonia mangrovi]
MAARIPSLTGIRTIAALSVCLTHAAFWTGDYTDDYLGRLLSRFEIGVALFFVLSGYLLFSPWVDALAGRRGRPSVGRYFWHRARRILPAYWLTVLAVYGLFLIYTPPDAAPAGTGWSGFLRNMTLTQVYGFGHLHSGLTQMWSLAAEVVFYLALPVIAGGLMLLCGGRWRPDLLVVGLVALMLVSPIWSVIVAGSTDLSPTARLWAPAFFGWFVAGMLLAVVGRLVTRWDPTISVAVAAGALLLSGTAIAGEPTITPTTASATIVKHLLYVVVAVGLIGPLTIRGVDGGCDWWARWCGSRPMVWFGAISYEFFLVHLIILEVVMDLLGWRVFSGSTIVAFLLTSAVSVPVAWLLHRVTRPITLARTPEPLVGRG